MKKIYWKALLVSFIIFLATPSITIKDNNTVYNYYEKLLNWFHLDVFSDYKTYTVVLTVALIFTCLFRVFLGFHLEVGGKRYFVKLAQYKDNSKCFRFAFTSQHYQAITFTMLLRIVKLFLWFLLLLIPGVIKKYAYRMVPYILADNPNIGCKKAIELSSKMTEGHKMDMFILDLSFLGWVLLGLLAFLVGAIFVLPYMDATYAELYLVLRRNALENKFCSYEDLLLDPTDPHENDNPNSDPVFE